MSGVLGGRVAVLTTLLELYNDLADPCQSGNGGTQGSDGLTLMPATYTDSVRELERLLKLMREDRGLSLIQTSQGKVSVRKLHWHVSEWFIRCTTANRWVTEPARTRSGKKTTRRVRAIVTVRNPAVDERLVDAGVRWLAENWGLDSEPMLPTAVVESRKQVAGLALEEAA